MRFIAALCLASLVTACRPAPTPIEPGFDRARVNSPEELFPDDLDFVVRIDAARVRQNPALAGVVRDLAKTSQSELLDSIKAAFGDASALWVGTRWMSDGFHGDGVLAIQTPPGGDAARGVARGTTPTTRRRLAVALPDLEAFELPASSRGQAVLEIVVQNRGVVLVTAAEADAVLRVMRSGPDRGRLDPPARGLISFAGRQRGGPPFAVAATTSETWRGLTEGLIGFTGSLEDVEAIDVEASLVYASAKDAARAAELAKGATTRFAAVGGTVGTMADSVKLTEVGSSVRVRARVPFAWLAGLH
jgi:hypothetical protein